MPGISGSLVDEEGFPLANIDLYRVRGERQRFNILNNDYSAIMKQLEDELHAYHAGMPPEEVEAASNGPTRIGVSVEETRPAFAYIQEVTAGSPA